MLEPEDPPQKNGQLPVLRVAEGGNRTEEGAYVPVVAIGASAGGLKAFIHLLEAVPEQAGMAFVLIQHLSPDHESLMAELLMIKTGCKTLPALVRLAVRAA